MNTILENLISKDFTLLGSDNSRWARTAEHDSLIIDREKQVFFWNSRQIVGDALIWLTKVKGLSFAEARKQLAEYKDYGGTFVYTIKSQKTEEDIVVYPKLVDIFWENGQNNRAYWYDRLLNDETIDRFKLGYNDGWYTIPIYIEDTFRNFQIRQDEPKKKIRPWYRGVGPLLFNSDILPLVKEVIITEGTVDAILLNQLGFPAVSHTMGSHFHDQWYKYFVNLREIIYIADNDEAGIKAAFKVADVLDKERVKVATFTGYPDKFDTIDFFREGGTLTDFRAILKSAKKVYELESYFNFAKKQRSFTYGRTKIAFRF